MAGDIKTTRGRDMYAHEGYLYTQDRMGRDKCKVFWRCTHKSEDPPCRGRLHTDAVTGEVLEMKKDHNHGPNPAAIEVARIKTAIRKKARETLEGPSQIISETLSNVPEAVQGELPSMESIRQLVQNTRRREKAPPPLPHHLKGLDIPTRYRTYRVAENMEEEFLLFDSGQADKKRILIFGRSGNYAWSSDMHDLYGDGTFTVAPDLFSQLFVLSSSRGGTLYPIFYCLLADKGEDSYLKLFKAIQQIWPNLNPQQYYSDYDQAATHAFRAAFPNCNIHGSFFHLAQNIKSRINAEGLRQSYASDPEFALQAKMIAAFAFVPTEHLDAGVEALKDAIDEDLLPVLEWFELTYVRDSGKHRRRRPYFKPSLWSVYEQALSGQDCTDDLVIPIHRRLRSELGTPPGIWKFIEGLHKVQRGMDKLMETFLKGAPPPKKRRRSRETETRILNIVRRYSEKNIIDYLTELSFNFELD
ncbi:uncharacterized protein [Hyperolius riggenbachi]|uniref:uncharacterized protein n=1 Tax=Hyperolius riggenbachi TaxID=752182 RepID=UPI0035A3003D